MKIMFVLLIASLVVGVICSACKDKVGGINGGL